MTAWKDLERAVAKALGGRRKSARAADFGLKDFDVELPDFPHFKVDAKYRRAQPYKHHSELTSVRQKYCTEATDVPVLVTKNGREHGACVTLRLRDFAALLNELRAAMEWIPQRGMRETAEPVVKEL